MATRRHLPADPAKVEALAQEVGGTVSFRAAKEMANARGFGMARETWKAALIKIGKKPLRGRPSLRLDKLRAALPPQVELYEVPHKDGPSLTEELSYLRAVMRQNNLASVEITLTDLVFKKLVEERVHV